MKEGKKNYDEIRLYNEADLENSATGWQKISQGIRGFFNKLGYAVIFVMVQRIRNGKLIDLYEQPKLVLNPAIIIICENKDKIAFIRTYRHTRKRSLKNNIYDIRQIDENYGWEIFLKDAGELSLELPRGMAVNKNNLPLGDFLEELARIEALEEAGVIAKKIDILPITLCPDNAFFITHVNIAKLEVESVKENEPEPNENITEVIWLDLPEIQRHIKNGEINDPLSISALVIAGYSLV